MKLYDNKKFMQYYLNDLLPSVGAENLPVLIGNSQDENGKTTKFSQNPILELDSGQYDSVCDKCIHQPTCVMFHLSLYIEEKGASISVNKCKSFQRRKEE